DNVSIELDKDNDEAGVFDILNGAGNQVFSVDESGNMTAKGSKSSVVSAGEYGQRKLYAVESPQNWFEDFGSAQLTNGQTVVAIEDIFAQTDNLAVPYRVLLTPLAHGALH